MDDRLSWKDTTSTSQDYSSINFLFSTEEHVWTPAIIVENSYVSRTPEQPKCISIKQSFTDEWFNMCGQGYCSS